MSMDQRQQNVQVGAGLQESRLNTELIGFLQKYGSWAIYALLAVVLVYVGKDYLDKRRVQKLDDAYGDFRAALTAGNPATLVENASTHAGQGAVPAMSRIEAARLYLEAARRGLKPGADALKPNPEDRLDEAGRKSMAEQARAQVDAVLADSSAPELLVQQARWFKASLLADGGDIDGAVAVMKEVADAAKRSGFIDQELKANERMTHLAKLKNVRPAFPSAELPESAREPKPVVAETTPPVAATPAIDPNAPIVNAPPGVEVKKVSPEEVERMLKSLNKPQPAPAPAPETPPANPPANPPAEQPKP